MPPWLPAALLGFLYGTAVSGLKEYILWLSLRRARRLQTGKEHVAIIKHYIVRFFINLAALVLVYKSAPALIGAAIGLTMGKNMLLLKQLILQRKG